MMFEAPASYTPTLVTAAVDRINRILGQDAIRPAAMPARGKESGWGPRRDHESPETTEHSLR